MMILQKKKLMNYSKIIILQHKKEKIYISTISPEAKARPKPLNNENI